MSFTYGWNVTGWRLSNLKGHRLRWIEPHLTEPKSTLNCHANYKNVYTLKKFTLEVNIQFWMIFEIYFHAIFLAYNHYFEIDLLFWKAASTLLHLLLLLPRILLNKMCLCLTFFPGPHTTWHQAHSIVHLQSSVFLTWVLFRNTRYLLIYW